MSRIKRTELSTFEREFQKLQGHAPTEAELLGLAARVADAPERDCVSGATPHAIIKALVELARAGYVLCDRALDLSPPCNCSACKCRMEVYLSRAEALR